MKRLSRCASGKVFDRDEFHDYVIAHGFGKPTREGYKIGKWFFALAMTMRKHRQRSSEGA